MVESLAVAICVDKGLFKLEEPIARYWPSFAKHGKGEVTIAQLMRHESGLSKLSKSVTLAELDAYTRGDPAPLARIIEDSPPVWLNATRRIYHSMTRGWILAELIRRVDPQQRLFHEFVREEIAEVLGIDIYFLPAKKVADIAPLRKTSTPWVIGTLNPNIFLVTNLRTANYVLPYYLDGVPLVPKIDDDFRMSFAAFTAQPSHLKESMLFKHGTTDLSDPTNYNQFYNYSLGSSFGTFF